MKETRKIIIIIIVLLIILAGAIMLDVAILNSDLPDIWKWFLLK